MASFRPKVLTLIHAIQALNSQATSDPLSDAEAESVMQSPREVRAEPPGTEGLTGRRRRSSLYVPTHGGRGKGLLLLSECRGRLYNLLKRAELKPEISQLIRV
jgi:hypothetical protein